jgi:hypothetical protein
MPKFTAVLFVIALASPLQAMPVAPTQNPATIVMPVREACGAGMHRVNGVCVRNVKVCPVGFHLSSGRCVRT